MNKKTLKNDTWKIKWLKKEGGGRDNWIPASNVAVLS